MQNKIKKDKYSPYAVTAEFNNEGWPSQTRLSSKIIYRYIGKNMFALVMEVDLPRQKTASVIAALDAIERELGDDFSKTLKSITADSSPVMKHWNAPACLWENDIYYFSPIRIYQGKEAQTKTVTVLYAVFSKGN